MSQLIYNGVSLQLVKTNSVVREPRLSDDRVEYMWTDFTIDVNCIYNPEATSYAIGGSGVPVATPGWLPEVTDVAIRHFLLQPRRPFYYAEAGIPIVNIQALVGGSALDSDNGPTPLNVTVTRFGSSRTFFVRFIIKTSFRECPSGTIASAIASSRYIRSESIDGQYRSTMTTIGKTYFHANILALLQMNADAFRGYIIPNPMTNYKRSSTSVSVASNGIIMEWITVDVNQFIDLGSPLLPGTAGSFGITDMDMEYTTATIPTGELGISGIRGAFATVNAMAVGSQTANTFTMLQFLLRCALSKLGTIALTGLPTNLSMTENIFKNSINISLTFNTLPPSGQPDGMEVAIRGFVGIPLATFPGVGGINPQPPFSNATRGMDAYTLAVNAFATACYTPDTSRGGCDQTGSTPPDVYNYYGQCQGSQQVFIYNYIDDPGGSDYRVGGKQNFFTSSPAGTTVGNPDGAYYRKYKVEAEGEDG